MTDNQINLVDLEAKLQQESPQKIIKYALNQFENIAISFSGAEDVALIEMARKSCEPLQATLDDAPEGKVFFSLRAVI